MNDPAGQVDLTAALAEHGRWLRTVLAARGVERAALDDVMQEVAAAAVAGLQTLKDPQRLAAWLYRIAVVQALLYRRRTGRRRQLVGRFCDSGSAPSEEVDNDPLDWLLAEEAQQLVRQAVATLAPQDAEILLLKYTEDWSYRQLAQHLGMSLSAVEARLHRARGRLRAALARLAPASFEQVR
jgi:RNA polymerase sigma-70 factor (ECF subfamily)